jgi:hypothetical protein
VMKVLAFYIKKKYEPVTNSLSSAVMYKRP